MSNANKTPGALPNSHRTVDSALFAPKVGAAKMEDIAEGSSPPQAITLAEAAQIPLFSELPRASLEKVVGVLKRHEIAAGETLLQENERADAILFLLQGSVKIYVESPAGPCILGFCGAGDALGEVAVIDGLGRSACAIAQTRCVVALVSRYDFWETIWPLPPIPFLMARLLSDRVRRLSSQLQAMATLDASTRIARQIVSLVEEHGQPRGCELVVPFTVSQIELGQMVGATRVQVNRTMSAWRSEGIFSMQKGQLVIHDIKKLRRLALIAEKPRVRTPKTRKTSVHSFP